jgi:hypothetical protein
MVTVRISEAELARDIHAVLEKVQEGVEVIVERDHRPVAIYQNNDGRGRKISECIALAKAHEEKLGYVPVPDPDFAKDVQDVIDARGEPFYPPSWISFDSGGGDRGEANPLAARTAVETGERGARPLTRKQREGRGSSGSDEDCR